MIHLIRKTWTAGLCILLIMTGVHGQSVYIPEEDEAVTLIRQIYDEVSSDGDTPSSPWTDSFRTSGTFMRIRLCRNPGSGRKLSGSNRRSTGMRHP
jgi:hypothetical protein